MDTSNRSSQDTRESRDATEVKHRPTVAREADYRAIPLLNYTLWHLATEVAVGPCLYFLPAGERAILQSYVSAWNTRGLISPGFRPREVR